MIRLALRNLSRHRKRTAIALLTIGFGLITLILAGGFIDWIFWGMRENTIHSRLGHIQVTLPGYFEAGAADPFSFTLPDEQLAELGLETLPAVDVVAPRLAVTGLISYGEVTIGFIGEGVDPTKEEDLSNGLVAVEGKGLEPGDSDGIYLGGGLARNLGVTVGDKVSILATTATGGLNGVEGTVVGLFQTATKEFDDAALRLPIDLTRQLLRTSGAHSWAILLNETEDTEAVLETLQARYPASAGNLEFTPWFELAEYYNKTVELFSRQMDVVRLIIAAIITLSISNILIMGVMERTGEIGTLMAMGSKRHNILFMFINEGLALGLIGGLIGASIGAALGLTLSAIGIPMPPPPGMETGYIGEILVSWNLVGGAWLLAVLTSLIGSLYPAWKASRMEIVDALRYNK